jgi:NodT family efflux transporter outer membrane factor (OMF) lipoprotein
MIFALRSCSTQIFAAFASLSLAACARVPQLGALPSARAASSLESSKAFAAPSVSFPVDRWWEAFGDPQLSALINEAMVGAPSLASASARLRASAAVAKQTASSTLPIVSLDAGISGEKLTRNQSFPSQFVPEGVLDSGRIVATLNFDPDIWGKNRAALAAATSENLAARVDVAQVRLMLAVSIMDAYAALAQRFAEHDVASSALRIRLATAALTHQRVTQGLDTHAELKSSESRVSSARAELGALDEAISLTRNQIAALVGAGPDRGLGIGSPKLANISPWGLPQNLALNLIGRRPDLVAARLRTEAAAARIKVARADFYPNINLSALVGIQSVGLGQLFEGDSTVARFGPAISLPLFDGSRRAGRYEQVRAQYDQDVSHYDATLIDALRQVADAVVAKRQIGARIANAQAALNAAEDARQITALRYRNGLANQLQLLAAEDATVSLRRVVIGLDAHNIELTIALIAALGGGFEEQQGPAR